MILHPLRPEILVNYIKASASAKVDPYDLVSHGTEVGGSPQECWGTYTDGKGWGPAFQYPCVHSNSNDYTGGDTVWYNYVVASAGIIIDKNTSSLNPAKDMNMAAESICPKGWTLPVKTEIDSNRDLANLSPVLGGYYRNGTLYDEATRGYWWGSEAGDDGALRYFLFYNGNTVNLQTNTGDRRIGRYIRCVSEEKTVTDLTYMQDMTPSIANWIPPL